MLQYHVDALGARPVDVIVHIGAGQCSELRHYLDAKPRRIVLFEPNPEAVRALRRKAAGRAEVDIRPVAVSAQRGEAILNLMNFPDLSSLRQPTGLSALYPGLQVEQQRKVETIPPAELAEELATDKHGNCWLIIDAPGEEMTVVSGLLERDALRKFEHVVLRCGREALYEGAAAGQEILALLEDSGFSVDGPTDTRDPDQPCWLLKLDAQRLENERLRTELETLRASGAQERERLVAERDDAKRRLEELRTTLETKLKEVREECEELKESISNALKERDELRADLDDERGSVQSLTNRLEEANRQIDALRASAEQTKSQDADEHLRLQAIVEEKEQEITRLKDDLSVALRMQTVRENDLKDLQARYGELLEIKRKQDDLLSQLTARLSAAAEHLRHMDGDYSDAGQDQNSAGALLKALSGSND